MRFTYVVKDSHGQTIVETVESSDQDSLVDRLQRQGYFVVNVSEETQAVAAAAQEVKAKRQERRYTHNRVTLEDQLIFARQLATMLDSGVTLLRSLDVIVSQVESRQFTHVLGQVKMDVEHGASLSSSLAKHPKVFNQFWVSLIEVGEASGTMPVVLEKLAFYLEQSAAFNSSIISAVLYPAILCLVACGAIVFFAFFIGPRFEQVFSTMKVQLPLITRILLITFNFIKKKFLILTAIIVAIIWLFKKYISTDKGRLQFEHILFRLPKAGKIIKLIIVERFTSQMSILTDSGVPILHALDITQRLVGNKTCAGVVGDIKNGVREGELLVAPMIRSQFFPPMAIQMIMVGEETGELGKMLKHVAKFYQTSIEVFLKRFSTIFEPIMLVFMGVVIGVIVLAMFLPLFNLAQLGGAR